MNDRPAPEGSSGEARFTVNRSALDRQGEGRQAARRRVHDPARPDRPGPDQPRTEFDPEALERLAASLKARGQLQPIRVRWDDQADRYVVVVGERRWRAAALAGLESIACVVASGDATPEDLLEDQLVENALREDLRPIEQARAYRTLLAARGLTHRQLAERLQIGHASIARALALLDLPEPIQAEVEAGADRPEHRLRAVQGRRPGRAGRPGPPGVRGAAHARRDQGTDQGVRVGEGQGGEQGQGEAADGPVDPARGRVQAHRREPPGVRCPGPAGRAPRGGGQGRGRVGGRPGRRVIAAEILDRDPPRSRAGSGEGQGAVAGN